MNDPNSHPTSRILNGPLPAAENYTVRGGLPILQFATDVHRNGRHRSHRLALHCASRSSSACLDDSVRWGYFDKRWILALYGLGVVLAYFPPAMKRLLDTFHERAAGVPWVLAPGGASKLFWWLVAAVTACGFLLAVLDIGPLVSEGLVKMWDPHELLHLGPLQKLADGAVPYVGAKTQYGPGHQLITFLMMRQTELTLLGFRVSFFALNIIATGILFAMVLYGFGWGIGLAGIVFSRLFCPLFYLGFAGWFIEFRWMGPLLVGLLLPRSFGATGHECGARWRSPPSGRSAAFWVGFRKRIFPRCWWLAR